MRGYRIDHVIYAVRDVDVVTDQFAIRYGLAAVPGGMHPTWGTANRIVPLGHKYLELVHFVDPEVAAANDFGRGILAAVERGDRLAAWAVATDGLDADAARLGLQVTSGSRTDPTARSCAGASPASRTHSGPAHFPSSSRGTCQLNCTPARWPRPTASSHMRSHGSNCSATSAIDMWLGPHDLPVTLRAGASSLTAVNIRTRAGTIRIS